MHDTPPSSEVPGPRRSHRDAVKPLPTNLLEHSKAFLEEQLLVQGLALQTRCLEAGVETNTPARIPPPSHLAFASTLSLHPRLTTRTHKKDRHAGSNAALKHLRQVVNTLNVKDAGLKDALGFQSNRASSERSKRASTRRSDDANGSDDEGEKLELIRSKYYNKRSLWTHAEDFWAIVGWAINCSVLHKHRWERWRAWLEQMIDVLHNDLEEHVQLKEKESKHVDMGDSLLAQFISTVGAGRNNRRRIMRAITADGTKKMAAEFGEIWKNETKPPKKKKEEDFRSKKRRLDLDNDEFADYGDSSSEDDISESKKRKSGSLDARSTRNRRTKQIEEEPEDEEMEVDDAAMDGHVSAVTSVEGFGGMESIRIRQRLLGLLTRFSRVAPEHFMDTEDLFSLFTDFIRPLPLPIFQQFVFPSEPFLTIHLRVSLLEMLFQPFLGTDNPTGEVTQQDFETTFAPHAASTTTAADNAKVSLLVESLLRALWNSDLLKGDMASLKASIEKGIKARDEKVAYDGRKKVGKNQTLDEQARTSLQCSAERMMVLLDEMA